MKFMAEWGIAPGNYTEAVDRFLEAGAPMPDGLTMLGRWHAPGSTRGWLLCECDDVTTLAAHLAEWAPLLEVEVTPVIEDEDAAKAATAARG